MLVTSNRGEPKTDSGTARAAPCSAVCRDYLTAVATAVTALARLVGWTTTLDLYTRRTDDSSRILQALDDDREDEP